MERSAWITHQIIDLCTQERTTTAVRHPLLLLPALANNTAMSKPFQFSMRSMFAIVALFCVVAWECAVFDRHRPGLAAGYVSWGLVSAIFGAIFGAPVARPLAGAACGVLIFIVLAGLMILTGNIGVDLTARGP